jgi:hypothetical protein
MTVNEHCKKQFRISSCPTWQYDLDKAILTFSQDGVPKVVASIQVVGTASHSTGNWVWGWANDSFPSNATKDMKSVFAFGKIAGIAELTKPVLLDDEYLGWELTAVAAKVLKAKGAYRCPLRNETGFLYLVYLSIGFAAGDS